MNAENIRQAADGTAAYQMPVAVVDGFQPIEVQQQDGKRAAGAVSTLVFVFENVEQAPIVGESGERIADRHVANALEQARVIEQCAAKRDGIAQNHEPLGKDKRSIHNLGRLRRGKLSGDVQPHGGIHRAVKRGIFHRQAAAVPEQAHQENRAGQQLLRTREEGAGVQRNIRWQAANRSREYVGNRHGGQQRTGDFPLGVAGTGHEMLDKERRYYQYSQNDAAEPPGNGRPEEAKGSLRERLKEEDPGGNQDSAGKKEARAENQRDAVLRALEADESDGGEDEGQQAADDLEVTLKKGVRGHNKAAQPVRGENDEQKSADMRQKDSRAVARMRQRSLAHGPLYWFLSHVHRLDVH